MFVCFLTISRNVSVVSIKFLTGLLTIRTKTHCFMAAQESHIGLFTDFFNLLN